MCRPHPLRSRATASVSTIAPTPTKLIRRLRHAHLTHFEEIVVPRLDPPPKRVYGAPFAHDHWSGHDQIAQQAREFGLIFDSVSLVRLMHDGHLRVRQLR